ncbi:helix-turn-helix domain-containing protein [Paenibacillus sp.]|uniref:TetR/AcrR family transcriptional regulator n=1 Tax=Paenibacillus sp. TaxID=58172 RepID=UPI002D4BD446|nr:helix-turn-helix domain-containing protein [Paenibacillus sp.]HZG57058.1 helix-turn-helix domain-containing protein [Paenibacillus sp.]
MGLREHKKERTRRMLLEKASALFGSKGFEQVTTAEIAKAAGIAEGTLFNYFPSKAQLFIAAVMPPPPAEPPGKETALETVGSRQLAEAVVALLDRHLSYIKHVDKRLLRDYFALVYGGKFSEASEARASLFEADERILVAVADFFSIQKEAHPSAMADFDPGLAATCFFGCVVTLLSQYVLLEHWTYDMLFQSIYDQALFIMKGHVLEPS